MQIRVLGPFEVRVGERALDLGGPRLRTGLALLAAEAGRVVGVGALADALWGEQPPAGAERTVRTYLSRLRRTLAPAGPAVELETRPPGYHRQVLAHDPRLRPAPAPDPVPGRVAPVAQLPAGVRDFTGRAAELATLDALLPTAVDPAAGVPIVVLSGTAGVGKSGLALHWAHRVAARFPDGQLYANLRGFDPAGVPVPPAEALRGSRGDGSFVLPPGTAVPDLRGLTSTGATGALQAAGLVLGRRAYVLDRTCADVGRVLRQSPVAGTEVAPGSVVDIWVGLRPPGGVCP